MSDFEIACARYRAAESAFEAAKAELREAGEQLRRCIRVPSRRLRVELRHCPVPEVKTIIELAAAHYNVSVEQILGDGRPGHVVTPRQQAMRIARELVRVSLEALGAEFGGRDHGTILHACAAVDAHCATDPQYRADFEALAATCRKALGLEQEAS